eukprot:TRINITY_DN56005_c0_g1_i1.p1 TRINITY_DN56005_c0_g1~~TRINITY_DN56005_c0_g1_i1.p1  ORF type:complete len:215 (+),score=51.68 TRINITY_DN56005_c0_g1_i1:46-690(+)
MAVPAAAWRRSRRCSAWLLLALAFEARLSCSCISRLFVCAPRSGNSVATLAGSLALLAPWLPARAEESENADFGSGDYSSLLWVGVAVAGALAWIFSLKTKYNKYGQEVSVSLFRNSRLQRYFAQLEREKEELRREEEEERRRLELEAEGIEEDEDFDVDGFIESLEKGEDASAEPAEDKSKESQTVKEARGAASAGSGAAKEASKAAASPAAR